VLDSIIVIIDNEAPTNIRSAHPHKLNRTDESMAFPHEGMKIVAKPAFT